MKILWTCVIFCVLLGVSLAQNVVNNLSYQNHTVTTYKTSDSGSQSSGQGAAYTTSGLGGQSSGQGIISSQLCPGSSGCTTSVSPLQKSCSAGYALSGNMCVKSEVRIRTAEQILTCSFGYDLSSNGMCVKKSQDTTHLPVQYVCQAGYTLHGNLCYPPTAPIAQPPPYVQTAPYTQLPPHPPVVQQTQCPSGYSYNGANCAQYVPNCPTGYQYSAGLCHTSNPPCSYPTNLNCGIVQQPTSCCGTSVVPPLPPIYPPILPPVTPGPISPIQPIPAIPQCPPTHEMKGNVCFAKIIEETHYRPTISCPDGFTYNGQECIKQIVDVIQNLPTIWCPVGFIQTATGCVKETCVNNSQNCTVYNTPQAPPSSSGFHISNFINNHNPVNVTTNVNANSSTYVRIHLASEDSQTRVEASESNTNGNLVIVTPAPVPTVAPKPNKCCTVVSPRMCRTTQDDSWRCFHRRKQVCSSICERPQIYLRPRQPIYQPPVMVVPPMRTRSCRGCGYQAQHDCSGCYSRGYCPQYCSSYDCSAGECGYMSQQSYCQEHGGEFCSQDYGCLDGDYCEQ